MGSHFVYGTSHRHTYPSARLALVPSERIIIPVRFLSKKAVYLDSKVLCGPQCPCKKSAKLNRWYWSQTADLELIFSLFSKNSSIPMLILRGSLEEHVLMWHVRMYEKYRRSYLWEEAKEAKSPKVSCPNYAYKHKSWRTQ